MGKFRIKGAKCNRKENDKHLKEEFINGIIDDDMTTDILK